jgi:hypothetical protein
MTTLVLETDPVAVGVITAEETMTVHLADGRSIVIPLAWYPRLMHGSPAQRQHWQLLGNGYAIEWPDLDEHISVEGLLAGRRSGESEQSLARWLTARPSSAGTKKNRTQRKRRDVPRGKRRGKGESPS